MHEEVGDKLECELLHVLVGMKVKVKRILEQ